MAKKGSKRNKTVETGEVLKSLIDDPTRSVGQIAEELESNRQTVWRKKKKLENDGIIWGYTAITDDSRLNHLAYLILLKTKPLSKEVSELIVSRVENNEMEKQDIRLLDLFYTNGEFDWVLRFSAPDHVTARRYFDTIRVLYDGWLLEKPVMLDLNFCLVVGGKANPNVSTLNDFAAI